MFFALYVELAVGEALLNDICELRRLGHIRVPATQEAALVTSLLNHEWRFLREGRTAQDPSFEILSELIRDYRTAMFEKATNYDDLSRFSFAFRPPASIADLIANKLLSCVRGDHFVQGRKLALKVLVDDCEALHDTQQAYLNTIIRSARDPVSWVIAYVVNQFDAVTTMIPKQSLSDADREIMLLDRIRDDDFHELCRNVSSLRIYYSVPESMRKTFREKDPTKIFNLKARLGDRPLNSILAHFMRGKLSADAQDLTAKATALSHELDMIFNRAEREQLRLPAAQPAFVEYVAISNLKLNPRQRVLDDRARAVFRQQLARKQGAAFILAAKEARLQFVPYCGYDIIISLSDKCIRDFLDIMAEIYDQVIGYSLDSARDDSGEQHNRRLFSFGDSNAEIRLESQQEAVYRAAKKKFDSISYIAQPREKETANIVRALGLLTNYFQTQVPADDALGSPERGIFVFSLERLREVGEPLEIAPAQVDEILSNAERDGFLREMEPSRGRATADYGRKVKRLRLHRRFAPIFEFSHRGPYGDIHLKENYFIVLFRRGSNVDPEEWVKRFTGATAQGKDGKEQQSDLFEMSGLATDDEGT